MLSLWPPSLHPVTPEYHCLPATGVGPQNFCQETWIPRAALCYISPETVKDKQQIMMELETSKELRKEIRHESPCPAPVSPPPAPPSLSHPNTNPRLRFSALCSLPSPIHSLLPLNRAVFPSPHVLPPPPPSCLLPAFQPESLTQERNALCSSMSSVHLLMALCRLVQPLYSQSGAQQSGVGIQQPEPCWYVPQQIVSNQMYQCVLRLLCKGTYKTVRRRRVRLLLLTLPSTSRLFEVCVMHVPRLRSLWRD